jgi:hypothetical protein
MAAARASAWCADTSIVNVRREPALLDHLPQRHGRMPGGASPASGICGAAASSAFARVFSFPAAIVAILVAAVYFCCLNRNILSDPDIWWHLRNAQYVIGTHTFLRHDIYTSTIPGRPWIEPRVARRTAVLPSVEDLRLSRYLSTDRGHDRSTNARCMRACLAAHA